MEAPIKNLTKAASVIEFVRQLGVVDFCLCAGARNSPFITLIDENRSLLETQGQVFSFFEERSAAFFALGRSQQSQRPVVIITTSGTAATELISAAVEAYYTQTPLIFITADRPPSYRKTGAPQSIEQIGIFSHYSLPTIDVDQDLGGLRNLSWSQKIPLHLNVCFDEPLLQGAIPQLNLLSERQTTDPATPTWDLKTQSPAPLEPSYSALQDFLNSCKNPLFIVSGLSPQERPAVVAALKDFSGCWWIETLSGLRGHPELEPNRLQSGERLVQYLLEKKVFDGVVRIGSVPTTRVWRDLEERFRLPVLTLSDSGFSGLARQSTVLPLAQLGEVIEHWRTNKAHGAAADSRSHALATRWRELDRDLAQKINELILAHPHSELHLVKKLSQLVDERPLYLGNSLPVREWDWVAQATLATAVAGNRGANGIDGQLSSFFGWKPPGQHSWALLGDLTTLYDLSAPWILSQLRADNQSFTLVIMNNSGGQIFKPMFGRDAFINKHSLGFSGWAQMWGLSYSCLEELELPMSQTPPHILELRPSEQETLALRTEIEQLWKTHLL